MALTPLRNQYKRLDVFRCSQEAHHSFQGRVSTYHVLREKHCYPQGCMYFIWHCVLLEKGQNCIKGYSRPGKNCGGCTYYDEEKVHLQPSCLLDEKAYERFMEDLERFETWLESVRYRRVTVAGRIGAVKAWFEQRIGHHENQLQLKGYLLLFRRGFFDYQPFHDTFYVRVSESQMRNFRFVPKMKIEFTGEIREDRGRIVVHRPGSMEIMKAGWGIPLSREKALVSMKTSTLLNRQTDACLACPWGTLTDVTDRRGRETVRYRHLYCLKGITDPDGCYVRALRKKRRSSKKTG